MRRRLVTLLLALTALWCLVSGCVDLDWIVVENHYDMWNAAKDTWEFCPYLTVNWWLAYIITLLRIIIGTAGTTILLYHEAQRLNT